MWNNINFNKMAFDWQMVSLRKPLHLAFYYAMIKPLVVLHDTWKTYRLCNLYKLEHTGQICYLRGSLNDSFDISERRIYITNGVERDGVYIATEAENYEVWIGTEAEDETLWLTTEGENITSGIDYIIWVPQELYDTQLPDLKAHIDFYRVAGKRYKIFVINE